MISGATLLDYNKRYNLKKYIIKRVDKVVIPFLCWSIIAFLYNGDFNSYDLRSFMYSLINCKFFGVYWFIPMLITLYMFIPFLSLVPEDKRERVFKYCIIIGIIVNCVIPQVSDIMGLSIDLFPQFLITKDALLYVFIGYYISNYKISKKNSYIIYGLGLLGLALRYFGTVYLSLKNGYINQMFTGYYKLPCVLYSSAVYLFFKNLQYNKKFLKCCESIEKQTFGIYMIHYFIIDIIVNNFNINILSFTWKLGGAVLILGISWIIIKLMQMIPIIKKIVPE